MSKTPKKHAKSRRKPNLDKETKKLRLALDRDRQIGKRPCGKCLACRMGYAVILCEGLQP